MVNLGPNASMQVRQYAQLTIISLIILFGLSILQTTPGYMDAEYYYAGGERLVRGYGFTEEILWNFLDDPDGMPHPSHGYWMPLVSLLAAAGMSLLGRTTFGAAQLVFIVIAIAVPVVTAYLCFMITGNRRLAFVSGLFAIFSGYYLSYLTTTDSFGVYMLCGGLFLIMTTRLRQSRQGFYFYAGILGGLAGLMHLARADGLIWFFVAVAVLFLAWRVERAGRNLLGAVFSCLVGYLCLMGPWMFRNYQVFGSVLAPGGSKALWFTEYNDIFYYPAGQISFAFFLDHGVGNILRDRLWALGLNLQTFIAVQGNIILAPLIIWGLWRLRHDHRVQAGMFAWSATFVMMTVIFPFAGARGGFFHSGAALQPLWWSLAVVGLDGFITWGVSARGWEAPRAQRIFHFGAVILLVFLSFFLVYSRVVGHDLTQSAWQEENRRYIRLEQALLEWSALPEDRVFVKNAPGYYVANGRAALSIPNGDIGTLLVVAERYHVQYLLLEFNQLKGDDDLYSYPGDRPFLIYLDTVDGVRLYKILAQ